MIKGIHWRVLGTAGLCFLGHKSIDNSVENGKFISFPVGSFWTIDCGDSTRALAASSPRTVCRFFAAVLHRSLKTE
jgi:hypothetical protein